MSFGKGQKQKVYRRGRVERSAAGIDDSLTGFKRADQAGASKQAEMANFLGEVIKTTPGAMDAWNKQANIDNEEKLQKGRASFKNASPSQRKKYRDAIWSGELEPDESPYFREGLQIAQSETLTHSYGPSLFVAYENWPDKLSSDPKAFDEFIEKFNSGWDDDLSAIDDGVKKDHFWPKQTALISQLQSQHHQKQASAYREQSNLKESEALGKVLDPGDSHKVELSSDQRSLSTVLADEAEKTEKLNEFHAHLEDNFLKDNPQPFEAGGQIELITNISQDTHIPINGPAGKSIEDYFDFDVDDSLAGLLETDQIFGAGTEAAYNDITDVEEKDLVPEKVALKPNVPEEPKKGAPKKNIVEAIEEAVIAFSPDSTKNQVQLAKFEVGKADEEVAKITDHVDEKFKGKVNVYSVNGHVRIQYTQGVSDAEKKEIQASIANHVDYGYVQHKDKATKQSFVIKGKST